MKKNTLIALLTLLAVVLGGMLILTGCKSQERRPRFVPSDYSRAGRAAADQTSRQHKDKIDRLTERPPVVKRKE